MSAWEGEEEAVISEDNASCRGQNWCEDCKVKLDDWKGRRVKKKIEELIALTRTNKSSVNRHERGIRGLGHDNREKLANRYKSRTLLTKSSNMI